MHAYDIFWSYLPLLLPPIFPRPPSFMSLSISSLPPIPLPLLPLPPLL